MAVMATEAVMATATTRATARTPSSPPARLLVGSRVEGRDGRLGTVVGTRSGGLPPGGAALLVRQAGPWWRGRRRPVRVVPLAWVRRAASATAPVALAADRAMVAGCPPLRSDAALGAAVRAALAAGTDVHLPPRGLAAVRVAVTEGTVTLSGAVPRASYRRAARACARGVPGVLGVRDETVADEDLVVGVAQALLADPDTRAAHLLVTCRRGEVWLDGRLPSAAARTTASALAAAVPGVAVVHNGAAVRAARAPGSASSGHGPGPPGRGA
jgi:osmotically-inducible protein OsmY